MYMYILLGTDGVTVGANGVPIGTVSPIQSCVSFMSSTATRYIVALVD